MQAGHAYQEGTTLYYEIVNASHLSAPWVVAIATQEEPMQYIEWQLTNETMNSDEENPAIGDSHLP